MRTAAAVALLLAARPAAADFWEPSRPAPGQISLGAGFLAARASSGLAALDGARGAGLQLVMEYRPTERIAFDLRLGGFWPRLQAPTEINYPADAGDWSLALAGLHVDVLGGPGAALWLGLEGALHYAQMTHFAYVASGFGLGPSLGVDLRLPGPFLLRLGGHLSIARLVSSSDAGGRTSVLSVSADVLWVARQ